MLFLVSVWSQMWGKSCVCLCVCVRAIYLLLSSRVCVCVCVCVTKSKVPCSSDVYDNAVLSFSNLIGNIWKCLESHNWRVYSGIWRLPTYPLICPADYSNACSFRGSTHSNAESSTSVFLCRVFNEEVQIFTSALARGMLVDIFADRDFRVIAVVEPKYVIHCCPSYKL